MIVLPLISFIYNTFQAKTPIWHLFSAFLHDIIHLLTLSMIVNLYFIVNLFTLMVYFRSPILLNFQKTSLSKCVLKKFSTWTSANCLPPFNSLHVSSIFNPLLPSCRTSFVICPCWFRSVQLIIFCSQEMRICILVYQDLAFNFPLFYRVIHRQMFFKGLDILHRLIGP